MGLVTEDGRLFEGRPNGTEDGRFAIPFWGEKNGIVISRKMGDQRITEYGILHGIWEKRPARQSITECGRSTITITE